MIYLHNTDRLFLIQRLLRIEQQENRWSTCTIAWYSKNEWFSLV